MGRGKVATKVTYRTVKNLEKIVGKGPAALRG